MTNKFAYIEACDFISYPMGGTLSFAKQFVQSYEKEISLIGLVHENEPIGDWFIRTINGKEYKYFGICSVSQCKKTNLPKRVYTYLALRKYMKRILNEKVDVVFTQTPQFVFVLTKYNWYKFYFLFAGLGNSVALSKYKYLRIFGGFYERKLFRQLKKTASRVFAASDTKNIKEKQKQYKLPDNFILQFPTRFNENIFYPRNLYSTRKRLGISESVKLFIASGRLSYIKGWKLTIDTFRIVLNSIPNAKLCFIGDGEDKMKIEKYCEEEISSKKIILAGRKSQQELAEYLNAANVFVMSSIVEGWPTAMVEALACGKPIVTTNVSGAAEMVCNGGNGYIIENRSAKEFAKLWLKGLSLENPNDVSISLSSRFTLKTLISDFEKLCQ